MKKTITIIMAILVSLLFANPIVAQSYCDKSNKAYMGVQISNNENGVLVEEVRPNSGAESAGILKGDIIVSLDKKNTANADALLAEISDNKIGETVAVTLIRNNKRTVVNVKLGEKPMRKRYAYKHHSYNRGSNMPKQKVAFLGVYGSMDSDQLIIDKVVPNTAAEKALLLSGDEIVSVNGIKTGNIHELTKILRDLKPNSTVTMVYNRNGKEQTKKITLGEKEVFAYRSYKRCNSNNNKDESKLKEMMKGLKNKNFELEANDNAAKKEESTIATGLNVSDFKVYPNPNNGAFSIQFTLEDRADTEIRVTDLAGKEVHKERLPFFKGTYASRVELNDVDAGAYLIQITQNGQLFTEKLIVN